MATNKGHKINGVTYDNECSAANVTETSTRKFVSPTEKATWDAKLDSNSELNASNVTSGTMSPSRIEQSETARFVTDAEKTAWNGKAAGTHSHSASQVTAGTLGGAVVANPDGNSVAQIRNIVISNTDINVGSALATGSVYIVYEG